MPVEYSLNIWEILVTFGIMALTGGVGAAWFAKTWRMDQKAQAEKQLEAINGLKDSVKNLDKTIQKLEHDAMEDRRRMMDHSTKEHKSLMDYMSKKFHEMDDDHKTLMTEQLKFNTEIRARQKND